MSEGDISKDASELLRDEQKRLSGEVERLKSEDLKELKSQVNKHEVELALIPVLQAQFNRLAVIVGTVGTGLILVAIGIILKGSPS